MTTVISQIVERAKQCGEKHQQCWLSNEKFNELAKKVGNFKLDEKGELVFVEKGAEFDLKIEIVLEKCHTINAFARITKISRTDRYTGFDKGTVFKSPESTQEIRIL